nr:hypothetical protein [Tanacetum cinerariifolium]
MLLLLVQGKLTNLTVKECFAFNISLRMFKRSIVIQRRVEDLQLGVESYQKMFNLTRPDTYCSDLKHEKPSVGSDRGSKRRREGKEPESVSAPKEKATRSAGKSTQWSKSREMSANESATAEEPMLTTHEMEEPSHLEFETCADN